MNHNIQPLNPDDAEKAATSLANAFLNDPLQCYVLPDEKERIEKSPAHFKTVIDYGLQFGKVFTAGGNNAVVVWLPPGETTVTPEKAELGGLNRLPQLLGDDACGRFFGVLDFLEPWHQQDAPNEHWYTMVIGVDPAMTGKGLGAALMKHKMEQAVAGGHSIYLETASPDNIRFYTKLGFQLQRELTEPDSKLPLWTFIYSEG